MKKLLLLLLSVILFTSCHIEEPEDVNKYKGCVVTEKRSMITNDYYDILYIKLTPALKKNLKWDNNTHRDFYRLVVYKLDSKNLNVGDTIK